MRLNKYLAQHTGLSRRAADAAIEAGEVQINGQPAQIGQTVAEGDQVSYAGEMITDADATQTILFHKPTGYVCSRDGQGNKTIYELLPPELHQLKSVGRLDKYSSGVLLLTTDGDLAHELTHPKFHKQKIYEIRLDRELTHADFQTITKTGVLLDDGPSKLGLAPMNKQNFDWKVTMHEGRNRQIRRTFEELGYNLRRLHRVQFGSYRLGELKPGEFKTL